MVTNPELELAFEYVSSTKRHLFLTGKAGTGKTTFLHRIKDQVDKRMAIVAPTGVAAINAKGVTIHSLFQLPFGVLTPDLARAELAKRRFSAKKTKLLKSLDLLVIDEISMVRADVLDAIDQVLQRVRANDQSFGGLQLLMIGDLHQLPPVVKPEDWRQLREHYRTPYFFGSLALQKASPMVVQLKHIFRQSDEDFIHLLNKVRNNQIDQEVLEKLNQRYLADFEPAESEGYITLSSHNKTAREINDEKLDVLSGEERVFRASIAGDFPASMYPNEVELHFKVGAQVMFNKNDSYPDRLYYNGKIGTITGIDGAEISVQCPGEALIDVLPVEWENRKYELNEKTKVVEDKVVGTYEQHPLKLAWAITIHKSQGLTFEKVIIDAEAAFAHGQVYVALSRCKSFEGIVLRTPIGSGSVRTDSVVRDYTQRAEQNQPTASQLYRDRYAYQVDCLRELFNFNQLERELSRMERLLLESERSLSGDELSDFRPTQQLIEEQVVLIGNKFLPRLEGYFRAQELPAENTALQQRLSSSATYFIPLLRDKILAAWKAFSVATDNQGVGESIEERRAELELQTLIKLRLFQTVAEGFDPGAYLKAKADAEIDFEKSANTSTRKRRAPKKVQHPLLYERLLEWRTYTAIADNVSEYDIVATKALVEIANVLPTTKSSLLRIGSFGKKRFAEHGVIILRIIQQYIEQNEVVTDQLQFASKAAPKKDSKLISLEAFQAGKTIAAIAKERDLTEGTIHGHIAHFVGEGSVEVTALIDKQQLDEILPYLTAHPEQPFGEVYRHFDERYSYADLRVVRNYLKWKKLKDGEEE